MGQRFIWIDYAKAIGIILVVYGHVVRGLHNSGAVEVPSFLYELVDSIVYSFHMPLFFFLAGYFFYNSFINRGGVGIIKSKIDIIFYPYIVWSIIQGILEAFLSGYTNGNVSYSEVFTLLWAPRAQFWFLYALFICFCVVTIIFSFLSKFSIESTKIAIIAFVISATAYIYPFLMPDFLVFRFISDNFVYLMFGVFFSIFIRVIIFSSLKIVLLSFFIFVVSQFIFHFILELTYSDKGIVSLLLALVSIIFIVSLSSWLSLKKPNKLLILIGTSSMAIYLMHIIAGSGSRVIMEMLGINSLSFYVVVGCVIGVFGPVLMFIVINELKIRYVFSAPISKISSVLYERMLYWKR